MGEDDRTVLVADVGALAVDLRRVVHLEEILHERAVGDLGRIERDLDDLGVAGALGADLLVGREVGLTAGVAADGGLDAGDLGVLVFDAPETTGAEGGFLKFGRSHGGRFGVGRAHGDDGGEDDEGGFQERKQRVHGGPQRLADFPAMARGDAVQLTSPRRTSARPSGGCGSRVRPRSGMT